MNAAEKQPDLLLVPADNLERLLAGIEHDLGLVRAAQLAMEGLAMYVTNDLQLNPMNRLLETIEAALEEHYSLGVDLQCKASKVAKEVAG